jgi:hypothetical protein
MDYFRMFARIALLLTLLVFSMTTTGGTSYGQALTQGDARELGNALRSANTGLLKSHGHILDLAKHGPSYDQDMASNVMGVLSAFQNTTSGFVDLFTIFAAMIDPRDAMFVASVLKQNCQTAPQEAALAIKAINLYLANLRAPALTSEAIVARDTIARIGQMLSRCA